MKSIKANLIPGVLMLLGACSSQLALGNDEPALIASATPESRAELERIVSGALDSARVTLAEDVLTRESTLVIERNPPQSLQQPPLQGRNMDLPRKFRLLLSGDRCWLERVSDGKRWELVSADCVPQRSVTGE